METRRDASDSSSYPDATGKEAGESVGSTLRSAGQDIKDTVKDTASSLKADAREAMGQAQTSAAQQARSASNTLRETADGLGGDLPWLNTLLNKTAEGFDSVTRALEGGDPRQGLNALSDFARRQPALYVGLSVAAGFALARVGKTAIEDHAVADGSDKPTGAAANGYSASAANQQADKVSF